MRSQPKQVQMTRLLIQKPAAYAELDENARIALSVLQEDGWDIQRLDLDLQISVTTRPVAAPDHSEALVRQTVELVRLRAEVIAQGVNQWVAFGAGCAICGFLDLLDLSHWCFAAAAACVGIWALVNIRNMRKAAR